MTQGNKGFASQVSGDGGQPAEMRRPPRSGFLGARENRLSELATGGMTTRVHEAVDPALCRIWSGHNRDYGALSAESCDDLIASLRAQGRQEVPAIVRRVTDDPACRFEIICGARRHWSVTWLRRHDYPDFRFVVEPRELTDEEAFRIADLENRSRKDLSDFERATDYARAIERYYDGNQQRMADRLQVSKSWMSRYLELARLPPEIIACFPSPHAIGISHAAALAPLLANPRSRPRIMAEAASLATQPNLAAAKLVARLTEAGRDQPAKARPARRDPVLRDAAGKILLRVRREGRGDVGFLIPGARVGDRAEILAAIEDYLIRIEADR